MAKEGAGRYSILGVLSLGSCSGYDIKQFMEGSVSYFWSESYGQIYPLLKELETEGLVTSRAERQPGKPERRLYTLTEQGHSALTYWLAEPVAQHVERNELLLKLFFGSQSSPAVNRSHLQAYGALQARLLREYQAIEPQLRDAPGRSYQYLTLRYGIVRCQALLAWCEEALATLDTLTD